MAEEPWTGRNLSLQITNIKLKEIHPLPLPYTGKMLGGQKENEAISTLVLNTPTGIHGLSWLLNHASDYAKQR